MNPGFLPEFFLSRRVKPGFKPAEAHDVDQFVGQDVAQEGEELQILPGGQGFEDIVILEADPVKIKG